METLLAILSTSKLFYLQDWGRFFFLTMTCLLGRKQVYFLKYLFLVIYLGMSAVSCGTWDLVPRPQIEPRPPALGEQS